MDLNSLREKLRKYRKEDIIITEHAKIQSIVRDVDLEDVKENLINPKKLVYFEKQEAKKENEKKYDCYFVYSKNLYHRYLITINGKLIIVTIIKINRDWQKAIK